MRVRERTEALEAAIREQRAVEERMRLALRSASVGTWDWAIGTDRVVWDEFMHPLFGLRAGEFGGRYADFERLVHEDDRERVNAEVARTIAGGAEYDSEFRVRWPDGSEHLVGARGKVYRDEAGEPRQMTGVCWDQTRRHVAETRLHSALATLDQVAADLALPPHDFDEREATVHVGRFSLRQMITAGACLRALGRSSTSHEELARRVVSYLYERFLDSDDLPAFSLVRVFETRRLGQLDEPRRLAATRLAPTAPADTMCLTLVATAGDEPEWNDPLRSRDHLAIPLDDVDTVRRLPMLARLLDQLRLPAERVVRPDATPTLHGGVFHVEEARGSPHVPAQEFVEQHSIRSVIGFGGQLANGQLLAVLAFSRAPISPESARLFSHLGLSLRMAWQPLVDLPNKTAAQIVALDALLRNHERVVVAQEDVLRERAEQLRRANQELEQFASIASHDLQEPLRKIRDFAGLLDRERLSEDDQDYLDRMLRAVERMQLLIDDLLALSRVVRRGEPFVAIDLGRVLREVLQDLEARILKSQGVVEVGPLPVLDADPTQMRQLFQNLVGNALKYHPRGVPPRVEIQATPVEDPLTGERRWRIAVRDQGIGFDPRHAERIFQPFERLHGRGEYEGTGIGLAICRKIVDRHRGTLVAEGRPGQGATFTVTLPERPEPPANA